MSEKNDLNISEFKLKGKKINTPIDYFIVIGKGKEQFVTKRTNLEKVLSLAKNNLNNAVFYKC